MTSLNRDRSPENTKPRLVFVNRFYAPDVSATSQILTDVAEALAQRGFEVVVFTSQMSYDASEHFDKTELQNNVHVRRIWSTRFGRASFIGRLADYFSFYASITFNLIFYLSRGDVLISKTDPPMLSIPLGAVAKLKSAKLVNWLQDIFPEVAQHLGLSKSDGILVQILKRLRDRSLERARMNVAIGKKMSEVINGLQILPDRICVIHNFADDQIIVRSDSHSPKLRKEWGFLETDFIIGYSGNLGRAHDFETVLIAAEMLQNSPEIKFLFVGGGANYAQLNEEVFARGLTNIHFRPYQPRSKLNESLSLPNLHWASLIPALEGYIVPSKIYGIASAGRPLLMIGSKEGEVGDILANVPFGECIAPGDSQRAVEFILKAQQESELTVSMGRCARSYIEKCASRELAISKWESMLLLIANSN